ncbi:dr1-associated corepressor-like [Sycon ciliatum]|uniref:dr1-associated corepressor-like n=1 Tax=Sycon ciliatum TaxID=27933 RepID=UPI0031F604D0|eukprot:scpid43659/ scgid12118/ Dr1-associated corepressor; Dr1-associated protein 1; Negative co-factor 2-alpha
MPPKRKKFNSRFPPARVKKIMQTDEEVGKVAASVPILVSKAVEMFMQSLLSAASEQASSKKVKTMSAVHMKMCIESERQFDFLKDLVANVSDVAAEDGENHSSSGATTAPVRKRKASSSTSRSSATQSSGDPSAAEDTHSGTWSVQAQAESSTPKKRGKSRAAPLSPNLSPPAKQPDIGNADGAAPALPMAAPSAADVSSTMSPARAGLATAAAFVPPATLPEYATPLLGISQFGAARPDADDDDDYDA